MTLLEAAKYYRNRNLWSEGGDGEPFSPTKNFEADQAIELADADPTPGPATAKCDVTGNQCGTERYGSRVCSCASCSLWYSNHDSGCS
jgi:hypothetical protein